MSRTLHIYQFIDIMSKKIPNLQFFDLPIFDHLQISNVLLVDIA